MNSRLLALYHRLPPSARSLAATVHGHRLRTWRYGPESEGIIRAAFERERWEPERLRDWQSARLRRTLRSAAENVPYYRDYWREHGGRAPERLEEWPVLEKETLRARPLEFLADGRATRRMQKLHTSGTTGKPLDLWASREVEREWWALFDARWRQWYGVTRRDRWATIGGKIVTPIGQRKPPFWIWDASQSLLYMSTYHLAPDLTPHYLDALERYRVRYLRGYVTSLYTLAQDALRVGRRLKMEVAITYAEQLFPFQREVMEEAFGCPVRETYGMVEMAAAASECEEGRLHLWPEAGWVEVLDDEDRPVPLCTPGNLVATCLLNHDMPLVRYWVGDRVTLSSPDERCLCGRTLPILQSVEGRVDDVVYTRDGRRLGCLDVVHGGIPVREAQVIQESLEQLRVLYVPAPGFSERTREEIRAELRSQMGEIEVLLEEVPEVPRGPNGKFRMIVNRMGPGLPRAQEKELEAVP